MNTHYQTIDGRVYDLAILAERERAFVQRCYAAYQEEMDWSTFNNTYLVAPTNPLFRTGDAAITREVWVHPLYVIPHDLGDRLGIKQGALAREGDADSDPFSASIRRPLHRPLES